MNTRKPPKLTLKMPLSDADEKTLKLYNEALDTCKEIGYAYFDLSRLNLRIVTASKKIDFKIFNDVVNNKIIHIGV